jgi:dTDP-4-amino-4,6-dideoxygalactose transaminase
MGCSPTFSVRRGGVGRRLEREIEDLMGARLGRPCLFFPSGRLALYVALRAWLQPGDRILMSPVTDDVILFTVLAAGLRPVMAPVSEEDGNIEPTLVPDETWSSLAGVLTTNLYGLPDRVEMLRSRCGELGIPLIEDAAHAIETAVDGRLIGTFGDAAVFSLSKHVGAACGGVLAFPDEAARSELEHLRDRVTAPARLRDRATKGGTYAAEAVVVALHLTWPARWLRRRLGLVERTANRMPLRPVDLRRAVAAGPGLETFHSWVRVDRHDYRSQPATALLGLALRRLRNLDADRRRRIAGVERLRALPIAAAAVRKGDPQPLFRVPLLVDDRAAMIARLERRVVGVGYIYDPPLDEYAGHEFVEPSVAPAVARRWARRVFPADPLEAERVIRFAFHDP